MLIELHMLQSFAPSNLNRDDTNNPKDCEFGGVRRARISSQCLKRNIRYAPIFSQTTRVDLAVRTRNLSELLFKNLREKGKTEQDARMVGNCVTISLLGSMDTKDPDKSSVLFFFGQKEVNWLTNSILGNWEAIFEQATKLSNEKKDKSAEGEKKAKKAKLTGPLGDLVKEYQKEFKQITSYPDIALFGRMLAATDIDLDMSAACQVAHAISTHRVTMEIDFFTAVDDRQKEGDRGAAMMDATAFNSACFYRYASVDWDLLVKNLGGNAELAACTLEAFLRASISAVPTGKQNSFAANNPPSLLFAVVRSKGQACSLANAFEEPVAAGREGGLVAKSAATLERYWEAVQKVYGSNGLTPIVLPIDPSIQLTTLQPAAVATIDAWIAGVNKAVMAG